MPQPLLMTGLHEANFLLVSTKGLRNSIDTIAGQAKDYFNSPVEQAFHQNV
jgi:hypothetical protein